MLSQITGDPRLTQSQPLGRPIDLLDTDDRAEFVGRDIVADRQHQRNQVPYRHPYVVVEQRDTHRTRRSGCAVQRPDLRPVDRSVRHCVLDGQRDLDLQHRRWRDQVMFARADPFAVGYRSRERRTRHTDVVEEFGHGHTGTLAITCAHGW